MSKKLTDQALREAAKTLNVELAVIRAVDEVESRGEGFLPDGRIKILFERHKFHAFTKGKYDASHPNISNAKPGGYGSVKSQYARFSKAFELDKEAAMKSASWGRYQIMGFNYADAGFGSVGSFVDAMKTGEDAQLKAFVNIIRSWGLAPELREHKWASFARQYNGPAYKRNKYDEKLAAAYAKFKGEQGEPVVEPIVTEPVTKVEPVEPVEPQQPDPSEVASQQPEPPAAPQAPKPEVTPVSPPATSITTKIAAAAGAAGPVIAATGLKIGGVEFSTGGVVALAAVIIVGMIVAAWLWNQSQERAFARQRLSIENLASEGKGNVIAAGSKV